MVILLITFVAALFAQERWGVYCYDQKRWIGEFQTMKEANDAYREHFGAYHHTMNVLRCAAWNEDCTKNLSQ